MIPSRRLLFLAMVVLFPASLLAAVLSEQAGIALLLMLGLVAVALFDAILGQGALRGLKIETPAVVRLNKDRDGKIELTFSRETPRSQRLRIGLVLPKELASEKETMEVALQSAARSRMTWTVRSVMRGNFPLELCVAETASPLGLWSVRARFPLKSQLRVYPNLLSDRRSAAAVFLNRGQYGSHSIRAMGRGREFEKLRDYMSGDSPDEIHWKATARRGRPVTKVFQVERTQEVYVLVDASRLSGRAEAMLNSGQPTPGPSLDGNRAATKNVLGPLTSSPPGRGQGWVGDDATKIETHLERFVNAALLLGLSAEQQGDLFGLLTFSDQVHQFVRASNGQAHFSACRDALYTLQPRPVTPDFDELCASLRTKLRKRALLVFLTALDDPILAESFARNMEQLARQHLVLAVMITPPEVKPLFSGDALENLDEMYRELGGHLRWQELRELEGKLRQHGVRFESVPQGELVSRLVSQYTAIKQRQLL
jgi:uncharacterized protein (DUF58 family)